MSDDTAIVPQEPGIPPTVDEATVMQRDKFMCQCERCQGKRLPAHEVDHIVPLSQGGTDNPSNLRAINRECHKAKTAREANGGAQR